MLTHVVKVGEFTNTIGYAVYVEFAKSVYINLWFNNGAGLWILSGKLLYWPAWVIVYLKWVNSWQNFVDNQNRSKVDDSYSTDVLRIKNSMERWSSIVFFEIIKRSWYELFDRCFTNQKFDGTFEDLLYFSKLTKIDMSTIIDITFRNWLSWYQLFGNRTKNSTEPITLINRVYNLLKYV